MILRCGDKMFSKEYTLQRCVFSFSRWKILDGDTKIGDLSVTGFTEYETEYAITEPGDESNIIDTWSFKHGDGYTIQESATRAISHRYNKFKFTTVRDRCSTNAAFGGFEERVMEVIREG